MGWNIGYFEMGYRVLWDGILGIWVYSIKGIVGWDIGYFLG